MLSQYLQSLDGAGTIGAAVLVVSVALFVGIVIRTVRADRNYIARMRRLPLEANPGDTAGEEGAAP